MENDRIQAFTAALRQAQIYLITDAFPTMQPIEKFLEAAIAGGVGMVQLRERTLDDRALLDVARRCATVCAASDVPFVVNDRVDSALASDAHGVHLGQDDLPVASAREIAQGRLMIGLSTHDTTQVDAANALGVDYIGVGPIHETPTKPGRPAVGTELVRYAAARAGMPFFPIGGLDPNKVGEVIKAGATRISVLRWISAAADPERAARQLREACERARSVVTG
jgi:thiamine-phosphate pyrophosphorylase